MLELDDYHYGLRDLRSIRVGVRIYPLRELLKQRNVKRHQPGGEAPESYTW